MTWKLITFGGVTLPLNVPTTPVGTAPSRTAGVALPDGGYFDALGSSVPAARRWPHPLPYQATLVADTAAALETALFALEALCGSRLATLTRQLANGTTTQTCTARLLQVEANRKWQHHYHLPVTLHFEQVGPWYSTTAQTVVATLSTSPKTQALANAGTAPVTAVTISTAVMSGTPITNLLIARAGYTEIEYYGTIAAAAPPGKVLVIDTGAWSVVNDGVEDYDHFRRTANHKEVAWLRIPAASSITVTITRTGGGASDTVTFGYYEAWN